MLRATIKFCIAAYCNNLKNIICEIRIRGLIMRLFFVPCSLDGKRKLEKGSVALVPILSSNNSYSVIKMVVFGHPMCTQVYAM